MIQWLWGDFRWAKNAQKKAKYYADHALIPTLIKINFLLLLVKCPMYIHCLKRSGSFFNIVIFFIVEFSEQEKHNY